MTWIVQAVHKQKHEQGMQSSATPAPSEAEQSNCKEEPQEEQPEEDDAAIKEKKRIQHNARVRFDRKIQSCLS